MKEATITYNNDGTITVTGKKVKKTTGNLFKVLQFLANESLTVTSVKYEN